MCIYVYVYVSKYTYCDIIADRGHQLGGRAETRRRAQGRDGGADRLRSPSQKLGV